MRPGMRFGLSAIEKCEVWSRWKAGQTLHEIGRAYGKPHTSIRAVLLPRGGIPPVARRRSRLALTLAEREDISRGIASGSSIRELASHLDRAASTISREVARHGGRPAYRAHDADLQAWISSGLVPALRPAASTSETASQPKNEEGYDLFLRSTAVPHEPAPNKEAIRMLERAAGLDPSYAPAWDALGQRYYFDAAYSDGGQAALDRSNAALERAKTLDPNLVSAVVTLATNWVERGELEKAYTEVAQVLKRRPENGYAHFSLSYVLRYAGLLKEAQRECDTALALDPGNYQYRSCARAFYLDGNFQRGLQYLALDAGSNYSQRNEVEILLRQGKKTEALKIAHALTQNNSVRSSGMRLVDACLRGRPESEIEALSKDAQTFAVPDPEMRYGVSDYQAFCGRHEAALTLLRQAVQGRFCAYTAMDSDPLFEPLRHTAEFQEIRSAAVDCQNKFLAYRRQHN